MATLVLLRHGESQWNLENRFTGWVDVPLSPKGEQEAQEAGRKLHGHHFDKAYTSVLQRAQKTLEYVLEALWTAGPAGRARPGAQRAPLRRSPRAEQGRDGGEVRCRSGPPVASQLRHPSPGRGEPEGHRGPHAALLRGEDRPGAEGRQEHHHRRPRQQPALHRHASRQADPATSAGAQPSPTGVPLIYEFDNKMEVVAKQELKTA